MKLVSHTGALGANSAKTLETKVLQFNFKFSLWKRGSFVHARLEVAVGTVWQCYL